MQGIDNSRTGRSIQFALDLEQLSDMDRREIYGLLLFKRWAQLKKNMTCEHSFTQRRWQLDRSPLILGYVGTGDMLIIE